MEATDWDRRYDTDDFVWHREPNQFLPVEVGDLAPGRALDLACGEGRNAVWLAARGWRVTGVDFSSVGLDKARRLAVANAVDVEWVLADLGEWRPPEASFDLVIAFYLQVRATLRRSVLHAAARALAPAGTLLVVGHDLVNLTEGVGGPKDPAVLYTPDDLVADLRDAGVADLGVVRAERVTREVSTDEGPRRAIDALLRARRAATHG